MINKDFFQNYDITQLSELYNTVKEVCNEACLMTDTYALTTGDSHYTNITPETTNLIQERQQLYSLRSLIFEVLKDKLIKTFINQ